MWRKENGFEILTLEAICSFDSVFDTLVEYVRGIAGYLRGL